jgi:hypothetical protein
MTADPDIDDEGGRAGERCYQALSYRFRLDWEPTTAADVVFRALDPLEVPPFPLPPFDFPPIPLPPLYTLRRRLGGIDGFAAYLDGVELITTQDAGSVADHVLWRLNREITRAVSDYFVIHAGVVMAPGVGAVVLCAPSGSGKSSLTAALVRAGFGYLSDELAPIDPVTRRVHPFPKALTLKSGSFHLFPDVGSPDPASESSPRSWHLLVEDLGGYAVTTPEEVRMIILPRYEEGVEDRLEPITTAEAVYALAEQSFGLQRYGGRALLLLADVVSNSTCFRLSFDDLAAAVDLVKAAAAG